MMTEAEKQQVLANSQMLMQNEEYHQALDMLNPLDCVMASWIKGKIYVAIANNKANSFAFKHYSTESDRKQYRELLGQAYEHLYRTCCLLPSASCEIRDFLNPKLWHEIGKVENELARTKPVEDDNSNDWEYNNDDFQMHEEHHVNSMIDLMDYWSL